MLCEVLVQEMVPTLFQRRPSQSHVKLCRLSRRFIVSVDLATCDADATESRARHVYASPHPELVHRPEHAGLPRTPPLIEGVIDCSQDAFCAMSMQLQPLALLSRCQIYEDNCPTLAR